MTRRPETARLLALPIGARARFEAVPGIDMAAFADRIRRPLLSSAKAKLWWWRVRVEGDSVVVLKVAERHTKGSIYTRRKSV